MTGSGSVVVVGGTSGIGREIARYFAAQDRDVVVTGRDAHRAETVAKELGSRVRGLGFNLERPQDIASGLADAGPVDHLVLTAIDRDQNSVTSYDLDRALHLVTLKLVGYTEVVHALMPRMSEESSVVVFGGRAKDKPYPGSTTVSTVNGGVTGMVNALALELAPIRVNAIHPGIVGDSPFWSEKPAAVLDGYRSQTPTGRLTTMRDVVQAVAFLTSNRSVNAVNLYVDGGWLVT
jgi:NAD(P)-dependent dehydrogenase (short-subunit alcohol dehydrogenase family)